MDCAKNKRGGLFIDKEDSGQCVELEKRFCMKFNHTGDQNGDFGPHMQ